MLKIINIPGTFVKTFVYDYAEEVDEMVNHYAEDNELEIKSISVCRASGVFVTTVIFERGCES